MFVQRVIYDSIWGHLAAFLATTHKVCVCVENGLRIPEKSRRDDDSDPKEILFVLRNLGHVLCKQLFVMVF